MSAEKRFSTVQIALGLGLALAVLPLLWLYYQYNPAEHSGFPPCPFYAATGLRCPGCGSQRALHALLHGNLSAVWAANPLFLPAISYVALGAWSYWANWDVKRPKLRQLFFGLRATQIALFGSLAFWIGRNL